MAKDINPRSLDNVGGEGMIKAQVKPMPSHETMVAWVKDMIKDTKKDLARSPNDDLYQGRLNAFKSMLSKLEGEF